MKITLSSEERRYLGAFVKMLAMQVVDQPQAVQFWKDIFKELAPNRPTVDLRVAQVEAMLAICEKGVKVIVDDSRLKQDDSAASIRASVLKEHLLKIQTKLEARIREVRKNG